MSDKELLTAKKKLNDLETSEESTTISSDGRSSYESEKITEKKHCNENLADSSEDESFISTDNCFMKDNLIEDKLEEFTGKSLDNIYLNMSKTKVQEMQQIRTENSKCPACSFSFLYTNIPFIDFNVLPKTEINERKCSQKHQYDKNSVIFRSVFDHSCSCNSTESQIQSSESTIKEKDNYEEKLFLKSCCTFDVIDANFVSKIEKNSVPVYESATDKILPSTNHCHCNFNKTISSGLLEEMQRTNVEEKNEQEILENNKDSDGLSLKSLRNSYSSDFQHSVINVDNMSENEMKATVAKGKCTNHPQMEDLIFTEMETENITEVTLSICKEDVFDNNLNTSKYETLSSNNDNLDSGFHVKDKENGETSEKIFFYDGNDDEDSNCSNSGNIFLDAILKKETVKHRIDDVTQTIQKLDENKDYNLEFCVFKTDDITKTENKPHENAIIEVEGSNNFSDFQNPVINEGHISEKELKTSVVEKVLFYDRKKSEDLHSTNSGCRFTDKILKQESVKYRADNVQRLHEPKDYNLESCFSNTDNAEKTEKKSFETIIKDDDPNNSSNSTISENDMSEKTMSEKIETQRPVPYIENDWEILLSLSDYNEKTQNVKEEENSEFSANISENDKSTEIIFYKDSQNYEACNSLSDKKEFNEKGFIASLHTTVNNYMSSLKDINMFSVGNYCLKYLSRVENEVSEANEDCKNIKSDVPIKKFDGSTSMDKRKISASQNWEMKGREIKTLEDALNYFNIFPLLEELEISLENVRRRKQTKTAHEIILKNIDKKIQKLSYKFHPDIIRNKNGSEEEIKTAHKLQIAINAVRTALNILNNAFLEDLDTDHRFKFYMKLELTSLANENEIKSHIYEVLFQISLLSELKHQKITVEIQKFISESQNCIQSYFDCQRYNFDKHRDLALFHLKCCIKGYKKLQRELEVVENECRVEKLDNICCTIGNMASENQRMLTTLRNLKRVAKMSIAGSFTIFTTLETLDEYFILPFVCYINVILMCNAIIKNKTENLKNYVLNYHRIDFKPLKINGISFTHAYLLVSYFVDNELPNWFFKGSMSKEELKQDFDNYLTCFSSYLKDNFKKCNYKSGSMKNYFSGELKKCMNMMFDFQVKEKELLKNIEKFKKKTEERDEKYEKVMKRNEEFNKIIQERVEKSKKLSERTSLALSEKLRNEIK